MMIGKKMFFAYLAIILATHVTEIQSMICLSCNDSSLRTYNEENNICKCYDKYYDDGISKLCAECHYSWFF